MKKAAAILLLLCLQLCTVPAYAAENAPSWAEEAYENLEERGILGPSCQTSGDISRGDFIQLLVRTLSAAVPSQELDRYPAREYGYFADENSADYLKAGGYGILEGTAGADGKLYVSANTSLTREQAAKMLCSLLHFVSDKLGHPIAPSGSPAVYGDAGSISPWALPFTQEVASYQLMLGDDAGNFLPKDQLNWASAVVLTDRTLGLLDAAMAANASGLPLQSQVNWSGASRFGAGDYSVSRPKTGWASGYYTIDNGDGTVSTLTAGESLTVERFDAGGGLVSTRTLPAELPAFGSFLQAGSYFYLAFGQSNPDSNDNQEVWRIVQYDRDWNRVGSVSVNGGDSYTTEPFRSTVARMAASGDGSTVALYAARTRYDGHQSNITILMDTAPFRVQRVMGEAFPSNHVSHSFGQFIRFDGNTMVTVDHGDAYPRSFVLQDGSRELDLLKIYGDTGDNVTNAIGSGFEVSGSGYLFLGCSNSQSGIPDEPWNVFLAYTGKSGDRVSLTWLTHSAESITCARLVKLDENTFAAMWQQGGDIHYQVLDGAGAPAGAEQVLEATLMPPTQPVVMGGDICWVQTSSQPSLDGQPCLYRLSIR